MNFLCKYREVQVNSMFKVKHLFFFNSENFYFYDSTKPEDKIDGVARDAAEDDHLKSDRQCEVEGIVCPVNLAVGFAYCF